jgi:hypothetical protein
MGFVEGISVLDLLDGHGSLEEGLALHIATQVGEALQHMHERGVVHREPMIGSRARVSEVLSGKRALTLPMIRRLSAGLDLRADVLIQETRPVPPRRRSVRKRSGTKKGPATR